MSAGTQDSMSCTRELVRNNVLWGLWVSMTRDREDRSCIHLNLLIPLPLTVDTDRSVSSESNTPSYSLVQQVKPKLLSSMAWAGLSSRWKGWVGHCAFRLCARTPLVLGVCLWAPTQQEQMDSFYPAVAGPLYSRAYFTFCTAMLCQTSTSDFGKHALGHRLGVFEAITCPPTHCVSRKKMY